MLGCWVEVQECDAQATDPKPTFQERSQEPTSELKDLILLRFRGESEVLTDRLQVCVANMDSQASRSQPLNPERSHRLLDETHQGSIEHPLIVLVLQEGPLAGEAAGDTLPLRASAEEAVSEDLLSSVVLADEGHGWSSLV